jgi:hypothetical protein
MITMTDIMPWIRNKRTLLPPFESKRQPFDPQFESGQENVKTRGIDMPTGVPVAWLASVFRQHDKHVFESTDLYKAIEQCLLLLQGFVVVAFHGDERIA